MKHPQAYLSFVTQSKSGMLMTDGVLMGFASLNAVNIKSNTSRYSTLPIESGRSSSIRFLETRRLFDRFVYHEEKGDTLEPKRIPKTTSGGGGGGGGRYCGGLVQWWDARVRVCKGLWWMVRGVLWRRMWFANSFRQSQGMRREISHFASCTVQ